MAVYLMTGWALVVAHLETLPDAYLSDEALIRMLHNYLEDLIRLWRSHFIFLRVVCSRHS